MPLDAVYTQFDTAAEEALEWFRKEVAGLRSGRVSAQSIIDIPVEHYGARTPLQGVASVSTVDARTLVISPWDESAIVAIEKALTDAQVGAQPIVDGKVIRLSFPLMSEEVREATIKKLHQKAEEARVRLRKSRDEGLSQFKKEKQTGDITEDDFYDGKKELDERIGQANGEIESLVKKKEEEIRTV